MLIKNTKDRFGLVAIVLHWLMAILIIGMVCAGLYMTDLPVSPEKFKLYGIHKALGMIVLTLIMIRFVWRLGNLTPSLAELPWWEKICARASHWAFYILIFAMPISGWLMSSAAGFPVSFFGLFIVPDLISPNEQNRILFQTIHKWLAYGLIATFCVHVAAALKHHFIDKDQILRRMLWSSDN
jgi:cytochrome b561